MKYIIQIFIFQFLFLTCHGQADVIEQNKNIELIKIHDSDTCVKQLQYFYETDWCNKLRILKNSYYTGAIYDCSFNYFMIKDISYKTKYNSCNAGNAGCLYNTSEHFEKDIKEWSKMLECEFSIDENGTKYKLLFDMLNTNELASYINKYQAKSEVRVTDMSKYFENLQDTNLDIQDKKREIKITNQFSPGLNTNKYIDIVILSFSEREEILEFKVSFFTHSFDWVQSEIIW
ncbi:MAG: hypothetical protein ACPG5B_17700 [Chitinophagales bacterium]